MSVIPAALPPTRRPARLGARLWAVHAGALWTRCRHIKGHVLVGVLAAVLTVCAASFTPAQLATISTTAREGKDAWIMAQATNMGAPALGESITQSGMSHETIRKIDWLFDAIGWYSDAGWDRPNYSNVPSAGHELDYDGRLKGGILWPYRQMLLNLGWLLIPVFLVLGVGSTLIAGWLGGGDKDMSTILVTTVLRLFMAIALMVVHPQYHIIVQSMSQNFIGKLEYVNAQAALHAMTRASAADKSGEFRNATSGMANKSPEWVASHMQSQLGWAGVANQTGCLAKSTAKIAQQPNNAKEILGYGASKQSECDIALTKDPAGNNHPTASFFRSGIATVFNAVVNPMDTVEQIGEALMSVIAGGVMSIIWLLVMLVQTLTIWALAIAIVIGKNLSLVFAPLAMAFFVWPATAQHTTGWFLSHMKILFLFPFYTLLMGMLSVAMPAIFASLTDLGMIAAFVSFIGFIFVVFKGKDLANSYGTEMYGLVGTVAGSLTNAFTVAASAVLTAGVGTAMTSGAGAVAGARAGFSGGLKGIDNSSGFGGKMMAGLSAFGQGVRGAAVGGIAGAGNMTAGNLFKFQSVGRGLLSGDADAAFNASMTVSEMIDTKRKEREQARANRGPVSVGATGAPIIPGVGMLGAEGGGVGGAPLALPGAAPQAALPAAVQQGPTPVAQQTDTNLDTTSMWKSDGSGRFFTPAPVQEGATDPYAVVADKAKALGLGAYVHEVPSMFDPGTGKIMPKRLAVAPEAESAFAAAIDPRSDRFDVELAAAVQQIARADDLGVKADLTKRPDLANAKNLFGALVPSIGAEPPRLVTLEDLASKSSGGAAALSAAREASQAEGVEIARRDAVVAGLGLKEGTASAVIARHLHPTLTTAHDGNQAEVKARLLEGPNAPITVNAVVNALDAHASERPHDPWHAMDQTARQTLAVELMNTPGAMANHPGLEKHLVHEAQRQDPLAQEIRGELVVVDRGGTPVQYGLDVNSYLQSGGTQKQYQFAPNSRMDQRLKQHPGMTQEEIVNALRDELRMQLKQKAGESVASHTMRINRAIFVAG